MCDDGREGSLRLKIVRLVRSFPPTVTRIGVLVHLGVGTHRLPAAGRTRFEAEDTVGTVFDHSSISIFFIIV